MVYLFGLDCICGVFFGVGLHLKCIFWGWIAFVVYFFGWVDRELLAVVAPNVLSHSITVTDTLLRSVTYQHNGHDDDGEDADDYTNRNNDGDDGETLLEKFGNKICRQCCRGNPIKSDFEIFEHRAFQTFVWGKALK